MVLCPTVPCLQYHFFYGTSIVNCTVYPGNKDIKLEHWIHMYSYRTFFTMHNRTVSHTLHIFMLKQMKWWIAHFIVCINNSSIPFSGVILLHCSVTALSFPQYWVPAQHPCCQCFEAWQTGLICHLSCIQFTVICMTLLVLKPEFFMGTRSILWVLMSWAPSQYKDRLIYVWWFPC